MTLSPWAFLCCLLASLKALWSSTLPCGIWPAISACPWPATPVVAPGLPYSFECSLLKNSEYLKQTKKLEETPQLLCNGPTDTGRWMSAQPGPLTQQPGWWGGCEPWGREGMSLTVRDLLGKAAR